MGSLLLLVLLACVACGGADQLGPGEGGSPCEVVSSESLSPMDSDASWLERDWSSTLRLLDPESRTQVEIETSFLGDVIENQLRKRDNSRIFCPQVSTEGRVRVEVRSANGYLNEVVDSDFSTSVPDGVEVTFRSDILVSDLRGMVAQDPNLALIDGTRILSFFLGFTSTGSTSGSMTFTAQEPDVSGSDSNSSGLIIGGWPAE